jgi:hypothetical protein
MKKIITLFLLLLSFSCATNEVLEEETEPAIIVPKDVEIILTTTRLEFDEVVVSYQDFSIEEDWTYGPRQFDYDSNGNPLPIIISFKDYQYTTIVGNAYRNNDLPEGLKVQVFIDDVLVLEDENTGTPGVYATVNFDYEIPN